MCPRITELMYFHTMKYFEATEIHKLDLISGHKQCGEKLKILRKKLTAYCYMLHDIINRQ